MSGNTQHALVHVRAKMSEDGYRADIALRNTNLWSGIALVVGLDCLPNSVLAAVNVSPTAVALTQAVLSVGLAVMLRASDRVSLQAHKDTQECIANYGTPAQKSENAEFSTKYDSLRTARNTRLIIGGVCLFGSFALAATNNMDTTASFIASFGTGFALVGAFLHHVSMKFATSKSTLLAEKIGARRTTTVEPSTPTL